MSYFIFQGHGRGVKAIRRDYFKYLGKFKKGKVCRKNLTRFEVLV